MTGQIHITRSTLTSLMAIALVTGGAAAAFAFTAGWLTPDRLSPDRIIAAFDAGGAQSGFRRNHAKGLCLTGHFASNGNGTMLSRAVVFRPGTVPVIARFSLAGPMPFQSDGPDKVRALGLRFLPADGEEWRSAMIDLPVFPVHTADEFYQTLLAAIPGPNGKPDPAKMRDFVATHPDTAAALGIIKARVVSSGFADDTFHGLNAFVMTAADGTSMPVRWSFVPLRPLASPAPGHGDGNPNYLFDDAARAVTVHPLEWHLAITVGQPSDPTDNATKPWPADRRVVDAGTLTLDTVHSEDDGGLCTNVNFDPMVLPDGISGSDDPLPPARSSAYLKSFTLRTGETKPPSDVTQKAIAAIVRDNPK